MSVDTFIPESVFAVVDRGDVLRKVRSLHPAEEAITFLADAEAAAAASALLLENAYRQHQRNLDRVDRARQAMVLAPKTHSVVCPEPVPFLPLDFTKAEKTPVPPPAQDLQVVKVHPDQPDLYEGLARIIWINRMTEASKVSGLLVTASDRRIPWTATASYVDAMRELFAGAPVVARGFYNDKKDFVLTLIRAASREEWDVEDAGQEELMLLGQDTVTEAARIRKGLIRLYGPTCQACDTAITKSSAAALQDGDRLMLVCHPCKAQRLSTVGGA